jgi:hypothetical protein
LITKGQRFIWELFVVRGCCCLITTRGKNRELAILQSSRRKAAVAKWSQVKPLRENKFFMPLLKRVLHFILMLFK